jgi:hypothetical protein
MNNAKNREGSFYASKVHLFLNGMNTVMIIWKIVVAKLLLNRKS